MRAAQVRAFRISDFEILDRAPDTFLVLPPEVRRPGAPSPTNRPAAETRDRTGRRRRDSGPRRFEISRVLKGGMAPPARGIHPSVDLQTKWARIHRCILKSIQSGNHKSRYPQRSWNPTDGPRSRLFLLSRTDVTACCERGT